jgi:hypothetical protein
MLQYSLRLRRSSCGTSITTAPGMLNALYHQLIVRRLASVGCLIAVPFRVSVVRSDLAGSENLISRSLRKMIAPSYLFSD